MDTKGAKEPKKTCSLKSCNGKEYYCSFELALAIIGGKWKPLILWHLGLQEGVLRFGELKRELPRITQKMLTQQLRELESDGMLVRTVYAEVPPRVEYGLTELGRSVMPVLKQLCGWGKQFEQSQGGCLVAEGKEQNPETGT